MDLLYTSIYTVSYICNTKGVLQQLLKKFYFGEVRAWLYSLLKQSCWCKSLVRGSSPAPQGWKANSLNVT